MVRLMGGVGIYMTVLLLLAYASSSRAAEPPIAGRESLAGPERAGESGISAFDLATLEANPATNDATQLSGRREAGFAQRPVPEKAGKKFHGPALNYQAGLRGPVIELGVLGGTVKPRQHLAHLALDWDF